MTEDKAGAAEDFWSESLSGIEAPTPLMIDQPADSRSAPAMVTIRHSSRCVGPDSEPAFWTAIWALLLGRYTNEDQVLFGHLTDGRAWPVLAAMEWDSSFSAWQTKLSGWIERALSLPYRSADVIRNDCTSIPAPANLFDSLFVTAGERIPPALTVPLVVGIDNSGFVIHFNGRRFEKDAIERMATHLETLATSLKENPNESLINVPLLPQDEFDRIVHEWNATEVDFPSGKCLHQLFEEQVRLQPDAPAVTHNRTTLSYRELNSRANRIAHRLLELGVKRDTAVGVSLRRGTDIAAAFMGIAKAGAGYLPLDPDYPSDRLKLMVDDSAVSVLVTQAELEPLFAACSARTVFIGAGGEDLDKLSSENPDVDVSPGDLAYLIYTSGSTGMPKGVMVDHRGRVSNFCDFNGRFSVGPGDRLLGLSSISFDMCAYDVFGTLAAGAELVVGESGSDVDPLAWADLMVAHQITVWHSVPALLEMVVDEVESTPDRYPRSLRLVLLGGDWIPVTLPDRVKGVASRSVQVISMGGATEVSMDSTIYEIGETDLRWKSIPYGAPMWNQRAYVLDRAMRPAPIGVPGELYLGGIGVGRGYNNRPELTREKFVANPFVPGERLYRTGDLCRWRADGNLQILGRMDFQVKIRGFRIELGEIETALRSHPAVRETVVMARPAPSGEQRLVAYVIRDESQVSGPDLHAATSDTVNKWAAVFDSAYNVPIDQGDDPTFRIASWDSSFTGQPYSPDEVHDWVHASVDRILEFEPKRVFEIGCGTGLLLFRIAPRCETYVGIDTSEVALDHTRTHARQMGLANVHVEKQDAAHLEGFDRGSFDAVVINSVVQNFPDADYFYRVIEGAIELLKPGGVIFLGDLRDKVAERVLQSSISLHRAPDKWTGDDILASADRQMKRQEELIVDPAAFADLKQRFPAISHVEVELRRGSGDDEMTKFRYNAILTVGESIAAPAVDETVEYRPGILDDILQHSNANLIEIRHIPNYRIQPEAELLAYMEGQGRHESRQQLMTRLHDLRRDEKLVSPPTVEQWASSHGFRAVCRYAHDDDRRFFDALLIRGDRVPRHLPCELPHDACGPFFNTPLDESLQTGLTPELRRHLDDSLPHYMIPAVFVYLEAFPLSPNGKVNRRALPEPDNVRPELNVPYVDPASPLEEILARIWVDGLGIDRVGMMDPFVAVGGSSLLATQLVARVREIFEVQLPMKACLNGNLHDVKDALIAQGKEKDVDIEDVAEVYAQVFAMSDQEAQSRLEEKAG